MTCNNPGCLGNYDFEEIAEFARKRFVEGCDTISLLKQAKNQCEKEEIVLISLLDLDQERVEELQLCCPHAGYCQVTNCRAKLKAMIEAELVP